VAVAAVGVAGLAACEADGLALVVNRAGDGNDAVPGDGVCEVTAGLGNCTLRAALDEANVLPDHETITFEADITSISLTGAAVEDANAAGDLDITDGVTIDGGITGVTIKGLSTDRVVDVLGGADPAPQVTLRGLTLRDGRAANGAGVRLVGAQSTTIERTLITQNLATATGGGIQVGAGASLTLRNSTLGQNLSTGAGSAIWSAGTITMQYSTVAETFAGVDALHRDAAATGPFGVMASVVGLQVGGTACGGTITSNGGNIGVSASCGFTQPTDEVVADPFLSVLDYHGGPTNTYVPIGDSAVIDHVADQTLGCGVSVVDDARYSLRPQFEGCDAGAVEIGPSGGD
jgi:hypothetical protein